MDDLAGVGEGDGVTDSEEKLGPGRRRKVFLTAVGVDPAAAADEFHGHIAAAARGRLERTRLDDVGDRGMIEAALMVCLPAHPPRFAGGPLRHLHGHQPVGARLPRPVNPAEAPLADQFLEPVAAVDRRPHEPAGDPILVGEVAEAEGGKLGISHAVDFVGPPGGLPMGGRPTLFSAIIPPIPTSLGPILAGR